MPQIGGCRLQLPQLPNGFGLWPSPPHRLNRAPCSRSSRRRCSVDLNQGFPHAHRAVVGVEHGLGTAVDRHAGADGGLGDIDGSDVGAHQLPQCVGQCLAELAAEVGARKRDGRLWSSMADQNDAGGQRIGVVAYHSPLSLGTHRPSTADTKAGTDSRIQKCLPASASSIGQISLFFFLSESLVNRHGKSRMCLMSNTTHGSCHAVKKELFCILLASMPIWRRHQLFCLGHSECCE